MFELYANDIAKNEHRRSTGNKMATLEKIIWVKVSPFDGSCIRSLTNKCQLKSLDKRKYFRGKSAVSQN